MTTPTQDLLAGHTALVARFCNVSVDYWRDEKWARAVDEVSLDVMPGDALGIVGESGSGKSTLVARLMGYRGPGSRTVGEAWIGNVDMLAVGERELRDHRGRVVAFVPQNPLTSLAPHRRVGPQLAEAMLVHGLADRKGARREALDLLAKVHLPDPSLTARKYPHQLSGGQLQRIVIAMAMACRPRLLIMDEPTTALDVITQDQILRLVRELRDDHGTTVIYVSHDLAVVNEVCDRVVVMKDGRVVEDQAVAGLFVNPQHEYTRQLVEAMPTIAKGSLAPDSSPRSAATPTALPLLELNGVVCSYRPSSGPPWRSSASPAAIASVNLKLAAGETLGVIGESGCGKSTLAKTIVGLLEPCAGQMTFEGDPLGNYKSRSRKLRGRIQLVPQNADASLNPQHRVSEIIGRALSHGGPGLAKDEVAGHVVDLLAAVELDQSYGSRYPRELSGGERQRVAIARALATNPDVVVCDEILSALDVSTQASVRALLRRLQQERGLAYVFISHDMAVVQEIADRVAVMYRGRICEIGESIDVYRPLYHPYTHELLMAVPGVQDNSEPRPATQPGADTPHAGELCTYLARCPLAVPGVCDERPPPDQRLGDAHSIFCHASQQALEVLQEPQWRMDAAPASSD